MPDTRTWMIALLLALSSTSAAELSDPTRPSYALPDGGGAAPVDALRVNAVFVSGERRIAVVNGRRVREGDVVGGATVREIDRDRVTFSRGGRDFSVTLLNGHSRK